MNLISRLSLFILVSTLIHSFVFAGNIDNSKYSANKKGRFTENKGQIKDQNWQPRPDVLFSGESNGLTYHLKKDGLHYQLSKVETWKVETEARSIPGMDKEARQVPDQISLYRVDVNWVGANPFCEIITGEARPDYDNYYNVPEGVEPALFVKSYASVTYKNLYDNIDLKFYQTQSGELEYDFVVHPGGDYKKIQLDIQGATLSLNNQQELVLTTPLGTITEGALRVHQAGKPVPASWVLNNKTTVSYQIENFNPEVDLTIDPPVRLWGTYYGGSVNEIGNGIATDNYSNVLITGSANSTSNIATSGAHQTSYGGGIIDAIVVKFDASGTLVWGTYFGGSFWDQGRAIATDALGNVLVTGETTSSNAIATSGAHQTTVGGYHDAFVVKFDASGVLLWGTYYGGSDNDMGRGISVDISSNVLVTGYTQSSTSISTTGAYQETINGANDAFIVKFDSSGSIIWGTYYGGNDGEDGYCIAIDAFNNVFVTGTTSSTNSIATTGAHQTSFGGGVNDAFIVKFDSSGSILWGTYYGGNEEDEGFGITINTFGNILISGRTESNTSVATPGAYQESLLGNSNAFIAKLDAFGNRAWGTYYGTGSIVHGTSITTDVSGNVLLLSSTTDTSGIATTNAFQVGHGGSWDGFIVKFDDSGARLWGTYYGGDNEDQGKGITLDQFGNALIIGYTQSNNCFGSAGSYQETNAGYYDAFIAKFQDCSDSDTTFLSATACNSYTLNSTTYTLTGIYYQNLTNVSGCDSIVVLNLTIQNSSVPTDIYLTGYGQVTLNDSTYSISGNYSQILTNAAGCDSVLNIFVTILTPISAGLDKILCSGASTNMTADLPSGYTGFWTKIAGVGTIISPTSPTSQIKNISVGSSGTFVWTATDGILSSIDTVVIYRADLPANVTITNVTSTTVTFSWSAAIDPDSFFVRITENCTFSGAGQNFRVPGNVRSWTATGLKGCFNYCVKLRAQCNGINGPFYSGFSAPSSFNTSGPVTCGIVNGFTVTGIEGCTYKINWANATGCVTADSFRVRYREGSNAFINSPFTTGNSINLNLGVGTWEIRVQTWCNGQAVGTSPSGVYYTISDCTLPYSVTTTQNSGCNYKIQWEHCGASDSFRVKYRTGTNPYANSPFTTGNFVNLNLSAGAWDFRVQTWCNGASLGLTPVYTFSFPSCREAGYYNPGNEIISNLKFYPNPTQIKSYLSFTSGIEKEYRLKLSDITGKEIRTWEGNTIIGENTIEIPTSTLSAGMYFISFSLNNAKHELKLIVE